jgi:hypothetical protein
MEFPKRTWSVQGGSQSSGNFLWMFSQFLMVPVATFVYGMEMLLRTMQGMQEVTNQGMEVMVGPNAFPGRTEEAGAPDRPATDSNNDTKTGNPGMTIKEDKKLNDNNCIQNYCKPDQKDGKCLILWRYKILFIKRDYEHAFDEREDLIPDDVTDITAWKIAEFVQQMGRCEVPVPRKWIDKRYPKPEEFWKIDNCKNSEDPTKENIENALKAGKKIYLTGLPEGDKKFLRLYAQQLASYTRQDPKYEEQQIEVLKEIRDRI